MGASTKMSNVRVISTALLLVLTTAFSCQTEEHVSQPDTIRMTSRSTTRISLDRILVDGTPAGHVETERVHDPDNKDENDRVLRFIRNAQGQRVGFITDDHKAYRFRAHQPPELVGNHSRMERNVMAVLGEHGSILALQRMKSDG